MAKENMVIQGHTEEKGNFNTMIQYAIIHNGVLCDHVAAHQNHATNISPAIDNVLLDLVAKHILKSVVIDCNNADCLPSWQINQLMIAPRDILQYLSDLCTRNHTMTTE